MLEYMDHMGYLEFSHSPDYALGALQFAEYFQLEDLWVEAFSHCVGMNQILYMSTELQKVSHSAKANIDNAADTLDLHLRKVAESLGNFLEQDLSSTYLGLTPGARIHLERFRAHLHAFYVRKFGYWPPPTTSTFPKSLFQSMYFDFQNLYNYLVDLDSTNSLQQQKPASGGVCVLQNLQAFDERHQCEPLPHPNPLLPEMVPIRRRSQSQRALQTLGIGNRSETLNKSSRIWSALGRAANTTDARVFNAPLVRAYREFEQDTTYRRDEKVSITDARKVRWILIYCTLQMLVSVIKAPPQVRDVHGPTYPLCCDAMDPPWKYEPFSPPETRSPSSGVSPVVLQSDTDYIEEFSQPIVQPDFNPEITPDCQMDNYNDHIEIPALSSWRRTLSLRDPSTTAVRELQKQGTTENGNRHSQNLSKAHSMESSSLSRMLRRRSLQSSQSTRTSVMRSSIGSSLGISRSPSKNGRNTDMSESGDHDIADLARPVLQVPHPTPIHNETLEDSGFDFGFEEPIDSSVNHNDNLGERSEADNKYSKLQRQASQSRPRSPVLDSADIDRIFPKNTHKSHSNYYSQSTLPSASAPMASTGMSESIREEKVKPKSSAGGGKGRTGFDPSSKRLKVNRRLTLGTWTTEKSSGDGHGGESEGKRLRYSLLIRAI
jgi:hypothetical protein